MLTWSASMSEAAPEPVLEGLCSPGSPATESGGVLEDLLGQQDVNVVPSRDVNCSTYPVGESIAVSLGKQGPDNTVCATLVSLTVLSIIARGSLEHREGAESHSAAAAMRSLKLRSLSLKLPRLPSWLRAQTSWTASSLSASERLLLSLLLSSCMRTPDER